MNNGEESDEEEDCVFCWPLVALPPPMGREGPKALPIVVGGYCYYWITLQITSGAAAAAASNLYWRLPVPISSMLLIMLIEYML